MIWKFTCPQLSLSTLSRQDTENMQYRPWKPTGLFDESMYFYDLLKIRSDFFFSAEHFKYFLRLHSLLLVPALYSIFCLNFQ